MNIRFILNDHAMELDAPPDRRVVDLLREDLGLTGTKESCGSGECGSCSILVDGESRLSCLMLAAQLDGRHVLTVEGLARRDEGRVLVDAFARAGAVQCGFCTPGMVVAAADLLRREPRPDRPAIRRALGGNLCTASPAGDTLPPLYALGARVELRSRGGRRVLPLSGFITGPRSTALAPGEVLTAVRVKCPPPGGRAAYFKIGLRKSQAIAVASLAAWLRTEPDGTVADVRLAWGSVGPTVLTFPDVEAEIRGRPLEETRLRDLAGRVSAGVRPIGDIRVSAAYRRRAAGNLLIRLLEPGSLGR